MIPIRYNPNISNFKYVTQDSVTNTLGGKYPIIRKNGDTKYRQFNLSGTIFADVKYGSSAVGAPASLLWPFGGDEVQNLDILNGEWGLYKNTNTSNSNLLTLTALSNKMKIETEVRNLIIDFLYDNKPKLFRSFEEGNMIVHLSGISLTPNKILGRHIYDFSATVNEVCEYNLTNVRKYNLENNYYPVRMLIPDENCYSVAINAM
jgi:hypothetical protein